jgi:hypothetical protein
MQPIPLGWVRMAHLLPLSIIVGAFRATHDTAAAPDFGDIWNESVFDTVVDHRHEVIGAVRSQCRYRGPQSRPMKDQERRRGAESTGGASVANNGSRYCTVSGSPRIIMFERSGREHRHRQRGRRGAACGKVVTTSNTEDGFAPPWNSSSWRGL